MSCFYDTGRIDFSRGHSLHLVAEVDGTVVGSANLARETHRLTRHRATWGGVVVCGHYQGRGIARALLQETLAQASSWGIELLTVGVRGGTPAEEVYHRAQQRGFTWGAVRAPEQLLDDPHLHDRGFWKEVEHPELGRSFTYPGEAAVYNGSPWRISRRAPRIGEHNTEILCGELGLSPGDLTMLMENHVI